ncbi:MAG: hypothetical protein LBK58_14580 [Prevotellaceae bacterium]|jgi:hypothetical protein|nr:hypothetical protein [Prevotellaceae bacterium]
MRRKKMILPKLRDRNGDLTKRWYVELSQRNPRDGQMVRKRFEVFEDCNINDLPDAQSRYQFAERLIENIKYRIDIGWTIFNDTSERVEVSSAAGSEFIMSGIETKRTVMVVELIYATYPFARQMSSSSVAVIEGRSCE